MIRCVVLCVVLLLPSVCVGGSVSSWFSSSSNIDTYYISVEEKNYDMYMSREESDTVLDDELLFTAIGNLEYIDIDMEYDYKTDRDYLIEKSVSISHSFNVGEMYVTPSIGISDRSDNTYTLQGVKVSCKYSYNIVEIGYSVSYKLSNYVDYKIQSKLEIKAELYDNLFTKVSHKVDKFYTDTVFNKSIKTSIEYNY